MMKKLNIYINVLRKRLVILLSLVAIAIKNIKSYLIILNNCAKNEYTDTLQQFFLIFVLSR